MLTYLQTSRYKINNVFLYLVKIVYNMRIVDLFSGAGGLTFGFYYKKVNNRFVKNPKWHIVFANEWDQQAAKAFSLNFPSVTMINKDIKNLSEEEILKYMGQETVDLIIGGPPCQSYSTIGKRKYDDKARLYEEYYRILSIVKPKMFLFENVKGMLSMKNTYGGLVIDDIRDKFESINYDISYKVLDAADYGVPQHRERVFIIGQRKGLNISWNFDNIKKVSKQITVKQAIDDLPPVYGNEPVSSYQEISLATNDYQRLMRGQNEHLTGHFSSLYGEKMQTIINNVVQGEGKDYINSLVDKGILDKKYRLTSGYKNTYGRLIENLPCTTITNNMSTPSGLRCIHYKENRALTPREGARIQSFPDWFQFSGCKENITTQIGNAVPPLLAMKIAEELENVLDTIDGKYPK